MSAKSLRTITRLGLLAAIGVVLSYFIHIPVFPAAPFLKYDPADVPVLIGALLYGPIAGLGLSFVSCALTSLLVGQDGIIGFAMNFVATGSMVLVASLLYKYNRTMKGAIIALAFGTVTRILIMIPLNIFVTPWYTGAPREAVIAMLLPTLIPFNAIKALGNSILTFLLYKRAGKLLK